jgi:hypothetical protein
VRNATKPKREMKQIFFILTLILIQANCFGQKTILIKNKISINSTEEYYAFKANREIKNGSYKLYLRESLIEEGFYKNGVKDSIWNEYFLENKIGNGNYLDGIKVGIWNYFDKNEIIQTYDYTKKELVFYKLREGEKDLEYKIYNQSETIKTKLERPPLFLGGENYLFYQVCKDLNYPINAAENGTTGRVYLAFNIDSLGNTSNFHIDKGIGDGCDEEVMRISENFKTIWLPGILNGKEVNVEYILPVTFELGNK